MKQLVQSLVYKWSYREKLNQKDSMFQNNLINI